MNVKCRLLGTCLCHLLACLLFLRGFFPAKSYVPGRNSHGALPPVPGDLSATPGKLSSVVGISVLLVVDALRADFIFGPNHVGDMPFIQRLLKEGEVAGAIGRANQPTVTLPRIKAITTGTIPSFLDVVLNFGATELRDDSLLGQSLYDGRRMVFYGDETWINLFPNHFVRSEGTTSFFVNDFTQVDENVTRNVRAELQRDDWDMMILHYLGLDHIGHVMGPQSPLVATKLREMDDAIKLIYSTIKQMTKDSKPPLLVVCGDHGMSDSGSHGGASTAETDVPILFIGPRFRLTQNAEPIRVQQIDLAPTLSALLGLPTPINNIGSIIPGSLSMLPSKQQLFLSYANAHQVAYVARQYSSEASDSFFDELLSISKAHESWITNSTTVDSAFESSVALTNTAKVILKSYHDAIDKFRSHVMVASLEYDVGVMCLAIAVQWFLVLSSVVEIAVSGNRFLTGALVKSDGIQRQWSFSSAVEVVSVVSFVVFGCLELLCFWSPWIGLARSATIALMLAAITFCTVLKLRKHLQFLLKTMCQCSMSIKYCILVAIVHSVSLASTSFIEEEHQTWYHLVTTALLIALVRCTRQLITQFSSVHSTARATVSWETVAGLIATLATLRIARSWNRTGDKWSHLPDIGDFLNLQENRAWLTAGFAFSVAAVLMLRWQFHGGFLQRTLLVFVGSISYFHRAVSGTLYCPMYVLQLLPPATSLAQCGFVILALFLLACFVRRDFLTCLFTAWCLLSAFLLRPHNIPLLAVAIFQQRCLDRVALDYRVSSDMAALAATLFAHTYFFIQGNSNSLSRIDLTGGYVGLDSYHPVSVGLRLICSTYCLPVLWILGSLCTVFRISVRKGGHVTLVGSRIISNVRASNWIILVCRLTVWSAFALFAFLCRYHLFVWSVFAPKLLFEGAWSVLFSLAILFFEMLVVFRCDVKK